MRAFALNLRVHIVSMHTVLTRALLCVLTQPSTFKQEHFWRLGERTRNTLSPSPAHSHTPY